MSYQDYENISTGYETTKHYVGGDSESPWILWKKPNNCKLVYFLCIGGGGGGHGGAADSSSTGNNVSGGLGGGSGGVMSMLVPALFLPNTLYLKPGYAGSAGSGAVFSSVLATSGGNGGSSYVCWYPDTLQGNRVCFANGGLGGVSAHSIPRSILDGYIGVASNTFYGNAGLRFHSLPIGVNRFLNNGRAGGLQISFNANTSNTYDRETGLVSQGNCGQSITSGGLGIFTGNLYIENQSNQANNPTKNNYPIPYVPAQSTFGNEYNHNGYGYGYDMSMLGDNFLYGSQSNLLFLFTGGSAGGGFTASSTGGPGGHAGIGSGGGGGGAVGVAIAGAKGGDGGKGGPGLISIVCI